MQGIQRVTIEECNVKDPVTFTQKFGKDKGKEAQLWNIGLKIEGTWYNGALFSKTNVDAMSERTETELYFYEEEYQGKMYKKWRLVKDKDRELDDIYKRLDEIERILDGGHTRTDTPQEPAIDTTDDEGQPDDLEEQSKDDILPF